MASELEPVARPARRADAGLARATERDLRLLRWVAEQYAVSIPQLARLMGRSEHAAR
jgi:DNA-binding CsgD family transcriptional regulator